VLSVPHSIAITHEFIATTFFTTQNNGGRSDHLWSTPPLKSKMD